MVFQDTSLRVIFMVTFCSSCEGSAGGLIWVCLQHPPSHALHTGSCVRDTWLDFIYPLLLCQPNPSSNQKLVTLWKQDGFILSLLSALIYIRNSKFSLVLVPLLWIFKKLLWDTCFQMVTLKLKCGTMTIFVRQHIQKLIS